MRGGLAGGVHALTGHGWVNVSGIAGKENPPFPIAPGEAGFICEARYPNRIARPEIPAENAGRASRDLGERYRLGGCNIGGRCINDANSVIDTNATWREKQNTSFGYQVQDRFLWWRVKRNVSQSHRI